METTLLQKTCVCRLCSIICVYVSIVREEEVQGRVFNLDATVRGMQKVYH